MSQARRQQVFAQPPPKAQSRRYVHPYNVASELSFCQPDRLSTSLASSQAHGGARRALWQRRVLRGERVNFLLPHREVLGHTGPTCGF